MNIAIEKELKLANLQSIEITLTKIIQLYETKNSRHSVMIVGLSGSGKSVTWKMLRNTLTRLKKESKGAQYQAVKVHACMVCKYTVTLVSVHIIWEYYSVGMETKTLLA